MASKNSKTKTQSKKTSEISDDIVNEIMDIEMAPKKVKEVDAVAKEDAPIVDEKVEELPITETTDIVIEDEVAQDEENVAIEMGVEEEVQADSITKEKIAVEVAEEASGEIKEEKIVEPQTVIKEAPRRRRTTREVYGYDVSGYNYDL